MVPLTHDRRPSSIVDILSRVALYVNILVSCYVNSECKTWPRFATCNINIYMYMVSPLELNHHAYHITMVIVVSIIHLIVLSVNIFLNKRGSVCDLLNEDQAHST